MNKTLDVSDVQDRVELPGGDTIILVARLGQEHVFSHLEIARNVYRIDPNGNIKWTVHSEFDGDGDPFTKLRFDQVLSAYRWDGGSYSIDIDTGLALPQVLER